jgi:hypothetical protein
MIDDLYMVTRWDVQHPKDPPALFPITEKAAATFGRSQPVLRIQNDGSLKVAGASDANVYLFDSEQGIAKVARPPSTSIADALIGVGLSEDGSKVLVRDSSGVHVVPAPKALPGGSRPSLPANPPELKALPAPRQNSDPDSNP